MSEHRSRFPSLPYLTKALAVSLTLTATMSANAAVTNSVSDTLSILGTKGGAPENVAKLLSAGGLVMIPLALLSVVTLALVLVYLVTLRRGVVASTRFMTTAETLLAKGDLMGLLAIANRHRDIDRKSVV